MDTLVVGEQPAVSAWLRRRRELGQDRRDEVWKGIYHVAPLEHVRNGLVAAQLSALISPLAAERGLWVSNPFNLGDADDYRGPDLGVLRLDAELSLYMPTAEIVVEVLSPHDETWQKLPHYAAHGVGEVWVLDPERRTVQMFALAEGRYLPAESSARMALAARSVEETITWP